jgi:hypothetical protein
MPSHKELFSFSSLCLSLDLAVTTNWQRVSTSLWHPGYRSVRVGLTLELSELCANGLALVERAPRCYVPSMIGIVLYFPTAFSASSSKDGSPVDKPTPARLRQTSSFGPRPPVNDQTGHVYRLQPDVCSSGILGDRRRCACNSSTGSPLGTRCGSQPCLCLRRRHSPSPPRCRRSSQSRACLHPCP